MSAPHRGTCRAESDAAAATARLRFAAARARRMSLDSFFSVLAVPEGRFDRTRKVDRRQQVNSPSKSDGMILRPDGRLAKRKPRTAHLAATVHERETVNLTTGEH